MKMKMKMKMGLATKTQKTPPSPYPFCHLSPFCVLLLYPLLCRVFLLEPFFLQLLKAALAALASLLSLPFWLVVGHRCLPGLGYVDVFFRQS